MKLTLPRPIVTLIRLSICQLFGLLLVVTACLAEDGHQSLQPSAKEFAPLPRANAPIVLCIDSKPSIGGQPSDQAYAQAAANGFRSVLTLRARTDGVDQWRERLMVEKNRLRYFNLPVLSTHSGLDHLDEFLRLVRDKANHPMLVNCAFAERVAPYMMIFNLVEQGWSEERAVEDASRSGLRREDLQALARGYLKSRANKSKPKARS